MILTTNTLSQASPAQDALMAQAAGALRADEIRLLQQAVRMIEFAYRDHQAADERVVHPVEHAVAVTRILLEYNLDIETIVAALLHGVVEQTGVTFAQIEENFGPGVAGLVYGVAKLSTLPDKAGEAKKQAENLRKLILATASDVRVMLLRLAIQLHNTRIQDRYSLAQQESVARETMEIYAPIAGRLGMSKMKSELEDLAFKTLYPEEFAEIETKLSARRREHAERLGAIRQTLLSALRKAGLHVSPDCITTRQKHIYSIYRKLNTEKYYGKDVWRIYDRLGIRVIVETIPDCYQALGVVHSLWKVVPNEFDDYISNPRPTGYQSLHTAVQYGDDPRDIIEVQIRTHEMHEQAEYGIAAHWRYKEGAAWQDIEFDNKVSWLRQLLELGRELSDAQDFVDAMKSDVFADRVYVFSPDEDILDLPAGATPIDFAYHIHTVIGDRCRGAKVNGKLVPLDYKLQTGDKVEIVTAKRGGPSRDWLNLGYATTRRAKTKIRQWFRRQDREKMLGQGREVIDRELKRLGVTNMSHEAVKNLFESFKDRTVEEFLAAVGFGDINSDSIAARILEAERSQRPDDLLKPAVTRPAQPLPSAGINILGAEGLLVNRAQCCNPVIGDEIIGYITRGRGVTVHRVDCPNIRSIKERERLINVSWGQQTEHNYQVPVVIKAHNRTGLVRDISTVVADLDVGISNISLSTNSRNVTTFIVTLEVSDLPQLARVFRKITQLPNVIDVRRRAP
ncbi:MAG: bifunctional (p)ppGpp synthetase/guanosine-3',5'-bis(diphosphate) 3'-pyrophosphohydrolase [Anaerolineae bacterium]|nr:bifunctional (p)ppGpp synthetase/guanosine-3',5'-bis(diphosphate) 3'-pyrophosphohydrolase [Anaerolineae bacterium]